MSVSNPTRGGAAAAPASGSDRFATLDSLRGLCALLVAAYHFNPAAQSLLGSFLANAYLLVDFFFVLSGFVIAHAYASRLRGRGDLRRFVALRIARLYPLHVLALVPYVALELVRLGTGGLDRAPFTDIRSLPSLAGNLVLVQGLGVFDRLTWNGPSWSISAEFWTYLAFAALTLAAGRARVWFYGLAGALSFAVLVFAAAPSDMNLSFHWGFARCLAGFFAGAALHEAFFSTSRRSDAAGSGPFRNMSGSVASALEAAALAACVLFVALAGSGRWSLLAPLVFAAALAVFAREQGAVSRLLKAPVLVRLGALSYAVYMLHAFGVYAVNTAAKLAEARTGLPLTMPFEEGGQIYRVFFPGSPLAMDLATAVFLAVVVAVASFVHRYFELPARSRVAAWLGGGRLREARAARAPAAPIPAA